MLERLEANLATWVPADLFILLLGFEHLPGGCHFLLNASWTHILNQVLLESSAHRLERTHLLALHTVVGRWILPATPQKLLRGEASRLRNRIDLRFA